MSETPEVVDRYLRAAEEKDNDALAACFTEDGTVVDEGETFTGREAIRGWREGLASKYTYTTTVTGSAPVGDGYDVTTHIKGDFPGGEADLTFHFGLRDGLITSLTIG